MMAFPITELRDEQACYEFLLKVLHPKGLQCPAGHRVVAGQAPHMSDRAPVMDYRCRQCGKVFNVFTSTFWKGTHYSWRQVVLLVRGFAQGVPTLHLARELNLDYETVLTRRHSGQEQALKKSTDPPERSSHRSRRDVSECGRKRHAPARRGGPCALSRQQPPGLGDYAE
jgi:transposase-like protein